MRSLFRLSLLSFLIIANFSISFAQAPDWTSVTSAGGTGNDRGTCVAVDAAGNSYVAGYFYEEATFGSITISSSLYKELFVAKMASDGTWLWAVNAGGSNHSEITSIALDAAGNAYVTGNYNGTPDFGGHSITSYAYTVDIFVAKITSSGTWQWATSAGSESDAEKGYDIALDDGGNIYITGYFLETANFGTTALTSVGNSDVFIAKLNPAGAWLGALGAGSVGSDEGYTLTVDASNHVYVAGNFSGDITFGTTQLTSVGDGDIFVTKLDSYLSYLWASSAHGGGVNDIATDGSGNAYLSGGSEEQATFGSITVSGEMFLVKISSSGIWTWAEAPVGTYYGYGQSLSLDNDGNIYWTGNFEGQVSFGSHSLQSDSDNETLFAAKLNSSNVWSWAAQNNGTGRIEGHAICVNDNQVVSITGGFYDTVQFGSQTIVSNGSRDIFCVTLNDTSSFIANFSADVSEGTAPLIVIFSDQSVGDPTSWAWDFQNDGTIDSDEQNPTFTYTDAGIYSVQLTVASGQATDSITMIDLIEVTVPLPEANFSADILSGQSPLLVTFSDLSGGEPDTWEWDFENDGTIDSYEQNPQHQYDEAGTFSVSLTVSNPSGTDTELKESYITITPPNNTFTVKQDGTGDYTSIQAAIDGVEDTQIIVVYPGTYLENINFNGKAITVESLFASTQNPAYIDETIINGGQTGNVVRINSNEGQDTELTGFTITNGSSSGSGGGIMMYGTSPIISYCKIENNVSVSYGGGIACLQNSNPLLQHLEVSYNTSNEGGGIDVYLSNPILDNILVSNNTAISTGGGVALSDCAELSIDHLTITENTAQWGGALFITSTHVSINNSILWDNAPQEIYFNYYYELNQVDLAYSDIDGGTAGIVVQNGTLNTGSGVINTHPFFNDGFRLTEWSPCIDTGDPDSPLDPDSTRADMGAFYFDPNYVLIDPGMEPTESFRLAQNFPNPFNPSTTISYGLPLDANVSLVVYDVQGNLIQTLASAHQTAGSYHVVWNGETSDGKTISTGIYFARLRAGSYTNTIKMLYLK